MILAISIFVFASWFDKITGRAISDSCIDSDGGLNYYVKGNSTGYLFSDSNEIGIREDYCAQKRFEEREFVGWNYVQTCEENCGISESFCYELSSEKTTASSLEFECPGACKNGACVQETTRSCSDSDQSLFDELRSGLNYYKKGTVTIWENNQISETETDYCNGDELTEFVCDNNNIKSGNYDCPDGCEEGKCLEPTESCTDTDNGINIYKKGYRTNWNISYADYKIKQGDYCIKNPTILGNGNIIADGTKKVSFCEGENCYLIEYHCKEDLSDAHRGFSCPDGCEDGKCITTSGVNIKDLSKYSSKEVFLVSDEDWRQVLILVPLAVWTNSENNIINFPLLIYHRENDAFDIDSIDYFFEQYNTNRISYFGSLPKELQSFLQNSFNIEQKQDVLSYWKQYQDVVYVEDNYELALLASTYASLFNAPLVIKGYNDNIDLSQKNIICVGNPTSNCKEKYSLEQLQTKYVEKTRGDKVIITNPNDLTINVTEPFYTEKNPNMLNQLYSKISLSSPILASAKHELILTTNSPDYQIVDSLIENKLSSLNISANFLTIIASPPAVQMTRPCVSPDFCFQEGEQKVKEVDNNVYGNIGNDMEIELATGRIFGITISDVTSNINRVLFLDKISLSNNFAVLWSQRNPEAFIQAKNIDSLLQSNGLIKQSIYDQDFDEERDLKDKRFISFLGDGWTEGWWMIGWDHGLIDVQDMRDKKIWLDPSYIISDACLTSSFDQINTKNRLFATNIFRRGALIHIGGVDTTGAYDISRNIYQDLAEGLTIGEALKEYKNKVLLFFKLTETKYDDGSGTQRYPVEEEFYILLGDPTIETGLTSVYPRITLSESNNILTLTVPQNESLYHIDTDIGYKYDFFERPHGDNLFNQNYISIENGNLQAYLYEYTGKITGTINSITKIEFIDSKNNKITCTKNNEKLHFKDYGTLYEFNCDQNKFSLRFFVENNKKEWMLQINQFEYLLQDLIPNYSYKIYYDLAEELDTSMVMEKSSNISCISCLFDNKCYPFNYRKDGTYCSINEQKFIPQLEADSVCENNFECSSNLCIDSQCVSSGLWQKFIRWLSKIFG